MAIVYQPILPIEQVYGAEELQTATAGRRLGAYAIDFVIATFTLIVGWYIWFAFTAPNGQTPGKQMLDLYVIRDDGTRAGGGYMWLREGVVKDLLFGIVLSLMSSGIAFIVAALWLLWDKDRQCLWDKITQTHVAYSPYGFRPETRQEQDFGGTVRRRTPGQRQSRALDGTVVTHTPGVGGSPAPSGPPGAPPAAPTTPAAERLRELRRLFDEQLITEEEYEVRRAEAVREL